MNALNAVGAFFAIIFACSLLVLGGLMCGAVMKDRRRSKEQHMSEEWLRSHRNDGER